MHSVEACDDIYLIALRRVKADGNMARPAALPAYIVFDSKYIYANQVKMNTNQVQKNANQVKKNAIYTMRRASARAWRRA